MKYGKARVRRFALSLRRIQVILNWGNRILFPTWEVLFHLEIVLQIPVACFVCWASRPESLRPEVYAARSKELRNSAHAFFVQHPKWRNITQSTGHGGYHQHQDANDEQRRTATHFDDRQRSLLAQKSKPSSKSSTRTDQTATRNRKLSHKTVLRNPQALFRSVGFPVFKLFGSQRKAKSLYSSRGGTTPTLKAHSTRPTTIIYLIVWLAGFYDTKWPIRRATLILQPAYSLATVLWRRLFWISDFEKSTIIS